MSLITVTGTFETCPDVRSSVAIRGIPDMARTARFVEIDPTRTFDRLDLYHAIAYARVESIGGMTGNAAARVHNACRWSGGGLAPRC
jgi:hypothetical protein